MTQDSFSPELRRAIEAALNKKAAAVTVLDLKQLGAFADYFLICSGASSRQIQAISNEIEEQLARHGVAPAHREGYENAEWVLLDYGDLIVHIFSERARPYYDLERLWRAAHRIEIPEGSASEVSTR